LELAVKELLIDGDKKDKEIATLKGRVLELTGHLTGRDAIIAERNGAVANLDAQRAALVLERDGLNGRLVEKEAQLIQHDQTIVGLNGDNAALTAAKVNLESRLLNSIPKVLEAEANLKTYQHVVEKLLKLHEIEQSLDLRYTGTVHNGKKILDFDKPDNNGIIERLNALKTEISLVETIRTRDIENARRNRNLIEMNNKTDLFLNEFNQITISIRDLWNNRITRLITIANDKITSYPIDLTAFNATPGQTDEEKYIKKGIALGDAIHQKEGTGYLCGPATFHKGLHYGELLYTTFHEMHVLKNMITPLIAVQNTPTIATAAQ
jgi:hypothetical protein